MLNVGFVDYIDKTDK